MRNAYTTYLTMTGADSALAWFIFTVSAIYQVTVVGLDPLQLVLVGTTLEATAFFFEVPTGIVADVYSRKLSIVIGYVMMGIGFIVEGAFPFFATVLLAQVIWGAGWTFTSGATEAWLTDEIGEARAGRAFLRGAQIAQFTLLGRRSCPLSRFRSGMVSPPSRGLQSSATILSPVLALFVKTTTDDR